MYIKLANGMDFAVMVLFDDRPCLWTWERMLVKTVAIWSA